MRYITSQDRRRSPGIVHCIAHVTNDMATTGEDFEKGQANGAADALAVIAELLGALAEFVPDPVIG